MWQPALSGTGHYEGNQHPQAHRNTNAMGTSRDFGTGRDIKGEGRELAGVRGQRDASAIGRGLYNIEEDSVNRVGAARSEERV